MAFATPVALATAAAGCQTSKCKQAQRGRCRLGNEGNALELEVAHQDTFVASCDVVKYAYDLNLPMTAVKSEGNGNLPSEYSLVSVNTDNIVIETVKEAEYTSDTVVRMYETKNTRGKATVSFGFDVSEVYLANLSEKAEKKLTVKDNKVTFEYKPFEIITLIVK